MGLEQLSLGLLRVGGEARFFLCSQGGGQCPRLCWGDGRSPSHASWPLGGCDFTKEYSCVLILFFSLWMNKQREAAGLGHITIVSQITILLK